MIKGLVLAGGKGTRLAPFTNVINKHMLPLGTRFMIEWPIWLLKSSGISEIMIVTGTEHAGTIFNYLGSGYTYKVQESPNGIAGAMRLAKEFIGNDEFVTVLGDNIIADGTSHMDASEAAKTMGLGRELNAASLCRVYLKSVDNPKRFGVARFENGKLVEVIEKPNNPPSDKALMGVYHFRPDVFDVIDGLVPSERGELEITHAIDFYLGKNADSVESHDFSGFWSDAGTLESYYHVNSLIANATPNY